MNIPTSREGRKRAPQTFSFPESERVHVAQGFARSKESGPHRTRRNAEMQKHTDDAPSGPPPSVSLPGVSMLRRRFILSSVFCLRSSTVLRMRCAREGGKIKEKQFSIMAFYADESIQRKYPRRFGCFKKALSSQATDRRSTSGKQGRAETEPPDPGCL